MDAAAYAICERPCAAPGLISYRCRGRYGWIMIGAKDDEDALKEARRSNPKARRKDLQVWDGSRYVAAWLPKRRRESTGADQ